MMFHPKHVLIKYEFQKHRMDHQSNNNNNNNNNNNYTVGNSSAIEGQTVIITFYLSKFISGR